MPHPTSLLPAMPGPCPLVAPCTGCLAISVPARPARPLRLRYVCVQCAAPVLVVCRLGFDRVGSRLLVGCFCFRSRLLCSPPIPSHHITSCKQHTPHASHTHHSHLHATRTLHAVHLTHTARTTHLSDITPPTPRTSHTHHIHTTPHPLITHSHPHQSLYHRLVLAPASLRWHTVYSVPWMHVVL